MSTRQVEKSTENTGTEQTEIGPDENASELEHTVWDALDDVHDLHIPVSLVDMAMIYDVRVDGEDVTVEMTYPCMGCPGYDMLQNDIKSRLRIVRGIDDITVEVVWDPVWSKDMLTEEARKELRDAGIGL